jgi:hypothetical protein
MVTTEEAQLASSIAQQAHEVAVLLGDPSAVGVGGHPGQVDLPGGQLDEEEEEYVPPL